MCFMIFKPMVLVQKWPFFNLFFFKQYRPAKCVLQYFTTKNKEISRQLKKQVTKLQKLRFFQRG